MRGKNKDSMYYLVMVLIFGALIFSVIHWGEIKYSLATTSEIKEAASSFELFWGSIKHELAEPLTLMLLQIIVIIIVSRLFGFLFVQIGQPMVMGEIVAGVVLGPSLLGNYFPEVTNFLFAPDSLGGIDALSKIGLILFMFVIGMELDLKILKTKFQQTTLISHASILLPFFLGMVLSYFIYDIYPDKNASFMEFSLFVGVSMSITAFPVLARILQERNQIKTQMGGLSIASAANGDLTAWCILAVVIAIAKAGSVTSAVYTVILALLYVLFMFLVFRPFMERLGKIYYRREVMTKSFITFIFGALIVSSTITQIIGVHALFGAFVAGVVMAPNIRFRKVLTEKIEDVSMVVLLPLFFVFTGLKTEIGLLNTPEHWKMFALVTAIAVVGKLGGTTIAARLSGESWKTSFSVGTLMNSRGLMELIVLNIGYEMKILPPELFVMLVLMALVTTLMTSPMLNLIDFLFGIKKKKQKVEETIDPILRILFSFGQPRTGEHLLKLSYLMFGKYPHGVDISALHLTKGTDANPINMEEYYKESFGKVKHTAIALSIPLHPIYKVTNDVTAEILKTVEDEKSNLLLVGASVQLIEQSRKEETSLEPKQSLVKKLWNSNVQRFTPSDLLIDKTEALSKGAISDVGIYLYKGLRRLDKSVVIIAHQGDIFLLNYARKMLQSNPELQMQILMSGQFAGINKDAIREFVLEDPERIVKVNTSLITPVSYSGWDLVLFSHKGWVVLNNEAGHNLTKMPSSLILVNNTYKPEDEE